MRYAIVTAPTAEPITLADAKVFLKTLPGDTMEDDAVILPIIKAAREYCENITGLALAEQTIVAYPMGFDPIMRLPRTPILDVVSVKYVDINGNAATMDADSYSVYGENIVFDQVPQLKPLAANPIQITYAAGYAEIPFTIRQAMLLLIGHWYSNREAVVVGTQTATEIQISVKRLLNQWKAWWY